MAAGNWVPEQIEMLGAVNLFGTAGEHSPWMQFDELAASDPDTVLSLHALRLRSRQRLATEMHTG